MADFIDREILMKFPIRRDHCDNEHANEHFINGIETVMEYAENLPTADVEPVRHGRWKPVFDAEAFRGDPEAVAEDEITGYECSICGRTCAFTDGNGEYVLPDVCLGCGSKMDGGTGNEM